MFRGFFRFKSIKDESKRSKIYTVSNEQFLAKDTKRKYVEDKVDLKDKFPFRKELHQKKVVGLRTVIDTNNSLKRGVVNLSKILKNFDAGCTFFISSGKAGLGESPLSLFNPFFYSEIIKSKRLKLEGFENVFSGLLLPSKDILKGDVDILESLKRDGFDIGSGSINPPEWIKGVLRRDEEAISTLYSFSIDVFEKIFKMRCSSFAAPSFFCSNATMLLKENFYFDFSSDCRGIDPFFPVIDTKVLKTPQVPITLPLMSEWFCSGRGNAKSFFDYILNEIDKQKYPVYEILPLYEGEEFKSEFENFLVSCSKKGIVFLSLREFLGLRISEEKPLPRCTLSYGLIEGRRRFATIQLFDV